MCEILVTGASGFLGAHIMRLCSELGRDVLGLVHTHPMPVPGRGIDLNLMDSRALMAVIRQEKPAAVIHAGALTSPDYCETHPEEADTVNLTATSAIAMASFAVNAHLVFVSTDLVFDGEAGMYTETDAPSPINRYARTKAQAEHIVRSASPDFAVVRPSFIYGKPLADHHASYSETLYRNLRDGILTPVFANQYRSPIEAGVLAASILEVSDRRLSGIWHVAGPERVSRAQFARILAEVTGLDPAPLRETSMDDVVLPASRPRDVSLDTSKARQHLKTPLLAPRSSLEALYHLAA